MSIANFNPTVWAGTALVNLRRAHVAAGVVNRDYQGDITAFGEKVKINNIAAITSKAYTVNGTIDAPDTLVGADQFLEIDQRRYVNFEVDDVDAAQQRPKIMTEAMAEAAHSLADDSDGYILSLHPDVDSDNYIGTQATPIELDPENIYEQWVTAGQILDENNVPRGMRWSIVPPWVHALMVKSPEFIRSTQLGDNTVLNGMVGQIAGFNILMSNNVDSLYGEADVMFGYPGALTFAEQILSMEAFRPDDRFADAVKGLYVYGAKVTRPKGLVVGFFDKAT
jgi:hypothetical protein